MNVLKAEELLGLFPGDAPPSYEVIGADEVPEPYRGLLVHEEHMTVTVEAFHGGPVDVRVLAAREEGDLYARKSLLIHHDSGRVVQFGIVRMEMGEVSAEVRAAIVAQKTPLGRILIDHDILRRIEPTAYLRLQPSAEFRSWFAMTAPQPLYGRLALIHFHERPVVEVLEIVAP